MKCKSETISWLQWTAFLSHIGETKTTREIFVEKTHEILCNRWNDKINIDITEMCG